MAQITANDPAGPTDGTELVFQDGKRRTMLAWRPSQLVRADRYAVALLVAFPILIEVLAALGGHFPLSGDDVSQNYPLRVLVGQLLRHGRLPLWDPYIWSGTPLLAGWNAGAMYPGTWLFAVLPAEAAWILNIVSVSVICGVGLYVFLRRLGCSPIASLLASLSFTYAGFMSGQSSHYGLVAGMSFTPWMLLAVHELAHLTDRRAARRWAAVLGSCGALVVLAGDPRSISSVGIVVAIYFLALCWRSWRARANAALLVEAVLGACVLALGLSAAQWLPGLSFLHASERATSNLTSFAAGSLTWRDLELLFVPGIVGADGLGLPGFAGSYNLPELSYAIGIVPLVAAFALMGRAVRRRANETPLGVWYVLIAVGVVLSAGANDPLGRFLASIPLYGGQRLQNRNSVIVDLALAVLLAVFVDAMSSSARDRRLDQATSRRAGTGLTHLERLAGLVPLAVVALLVAGAYLFSHWVQASLGVSPYRAHLPVALTPYYVAILVLSGAAGALLFLSRRLGPQRTRWLVTIVVACNLALSLTTQPSVTAESPATKVALPADNPVAKELSRLLGPQGRYAIFNPLQSTREDVATLDSIGPFDLGILHNLYSVQGYGSAVAGSYEDATGAHEVENLRPAALSHANFDILDLKELVTLPEYLVQTIPTGEPVPVAKGTPVPPGTEAAAEAVNALAPGLPQPNIPPFLLAPGHRSDWILPEPVALDSVTVFVVPYRHMLSGSVSLGVLNCDDKITSERQLQVVGAEVELDLGGRVACGISVGAPSGSSAAIGAVEVTAVRPQDLGSGPVSRRLVLNQILQGVLEPPHWRFETQIGGLPVFTDTVARPAAWLEPEGSRSALAAPLAGARATTPAVEPWQDPVTLVSTPRPAVLVRSCDYANGWKARITPLKGGPSTTVAVRRLGLVQAISVPAGHFKVTWIYDAGLVRTGLLASVISLLLLVALLFAPRRRRCPGRRQSPPASTPA